MIELFFQFFYSFLENSYDYFNTFLEYIIPIFNSFLNFLFALIDRSSYLGSSILEYFDQFFADGINVGTLHSFLGIIVVLFLLKLFWRIILAFLQRGGG